MSPWLLVPLIAVVAVRKVAAERAIVVDEPAATPFAATELAAAIRVRIASDGAPVRVRITPTTTGVAIETRGERREVELAGLRGEDAARMVALAADDLLVDEAVVVPARVAARPASSLGVLGTVAGWDGMLGGLALDLSLPHVSIEAGVAQPVASSLALTAGVIRAGGAQRAGVFELRGGVTLAPLFVSTGTGDQTILVGANASVRVRIELGATTSAILGAGVDAFATRTQYIVNTMTIATPWVAPWVTAGVEVGL